MTIPGLIISIATFPGVIVHEIAHQLFCKWMKVPVLDVCYFRIGNPSGYVIHEKPEEAYKSILIGVGPFFINSILGALISGSSVIAVWTFEGGSFIDYALLWLGISIAMHAFPSTGDAKSIWAAVTNKKGNFLLKLIAAPICALIYLGALGSMFWLDLFYGIAIAFALPNILASILG